MSWPRPESAYSYYSSSSQYHPSPLPPTFPLLRHSGSHQSHHSASLSSANAPASITRTPVQMDHLSSFFLPDPAPTSTARLAHHADSEIVRSNASFGSMSARQGSVSLFHFDDQSSPQTQRSTSAPENLEAFLNDSALAIGSGDGESGSFGSDRRKQARIQRLKVSIAWVDEQLQHTCTNGDDDDKTETGINDGGSTQTHQPSQSQSNMEEQVRGVGAQFPSLEDLSDLPPSSAE